MNCREFEDLLHRRLDGAPASAADVDEHLTSCPSCRALEVATVRLERGLRALATPEPPVNLGSRIVFDVLAQHRGVQRRRHLALVASLAAGLLLAFLIGRTWQGVTPPAPAPQPKLVAKVEQPPATAPLNQSVGEAGSALASLLSRTADETINQGRMLLPDSVPAPMTVDDWQPTFESPALPLREAGQGVSAGLEPVASSARRAFNLFLREIPPMPAEEKP